MPRGGSKPKQMVGLRFGRLVVIEQAGVYTRGQAVWRCQCDCGNTHEVTGHLLRKGGTKSCGCLRQEWLDSQGNADLRGRRFGSVTVMSSAGKNRAGSKIWNCRCDCGNTAVVTTAALNRSPARTCGCANRRRFGDWNRTHGLSQTVEYSIWNGIKKRCLSAANSSYADYGGRGITICDRWRTDFEAFLADMGPRPGPEYSVGRIDNDGPYSPENCRWETAAQQVSNRRRSNMTERLAAVLLMLKRGDGSWLIPEPLRTSGNARSICRHVQWDHNVPYAWGGGTNPQNMTPLDPADHRVKTRRDVAAIAKVRRHHKRRAEAELQVTESLLAVEKELSRPARRPMPGSRASKFKKHMDGRVTIR